MIRPHHRMFGVFFIFALSMGALLSRLPDLQRQLNLTEGQLGLTLIAMSCGALVGLTFSSPLIVRHGARTGIFVTIFGASACYALVPFMPSAVLVAPVFFLAGILAGAVEIIVNLETDRLEAQLGYRIMNRTHGMWSLGFFVTALISAWVRQLGVPIQVHLVVALAVVVIAGSIIFSGIENAPIRPDTHAGDTPRVAFPTLGLLTLCLIGAAPLLVEGAGIDWSAIYMRDVFDVMPFIGGLSVTVFTLFMAIARLTIDPVVDRFSPRAVAATLLVVAGVGLTLVASAPHEYVALVGFALMGVGCSAVYPLAVSAAAQRTDRPPAVNVASLGQMTFVVFFLGPPLLGFVAERFGIRVSYWVCLPLLVAALLVIRALPSQRAVQLSGPEPVSPHA
jgi:MFS family permease